MMEYDISDIARLFGLSPSGLRYYESLGLISPQYTESGRRKYTQKNLSELMYVRFLRSLGISTEETRSRFLGTQRNEPYLTSDFLHVKAEEMRQKAVYYQRLSELLDAYGSLLSLREGEFFIKSTDPKDYYFLSFEHVFKRKNQKQAAQWVKLMPLCAMCETVTVADQRLDSATLGLLVSRLNAEETALPLIQEAELLSAASSLHILWAKPHDSSATLTEDDYAAIIRQIQEKTGWAKMRLTSRIIYMNDHAGQRCTYYLILACSR